MSTRPSPSTPSTSPAKSSELQQRVAGAFTRLATSADELNAVSDELAEPIRAIEHTLKTLNLGVQAWVTFAGSENPETGDYSHSSVGYARFHNTWGLAISTMTGNLHTPPEHSDVETWRFNDAPRSLRMEALSVFPDLLDELAKTSNRVTKRLKQGVASTKQVALTLAEMASGRKTKK